jgi:signal transduction histidine kinase
VSIPATSARRRQWWVLTVRRRLALALLLAGPLFSFFVVWAATNLYNAVGGLYTGYGPSCDHNWQTILTSCIARSSIFVLVEIVIAAIVVVGLAVLVARVVLAPIAAMAESVERLAPNSLGLRLRRTGPPDEAQRLADAIDTLLDRVAEGYDAQRRFASNASHELRTPLATQRALIEVSLTSALSPDQLDLVARQLLATNERNERLVDGLLTLAESDRGLVTRQPQRLDEIVTEAVALYASGDQPVKITTDLVPVTVLGELALLDRLVTNLVDNAVKHNDADGWVAISVDASGTLTVANTGPLVRPDQVSRLFEPFQRLSGERLDHTGGVGLGLTIARSIVAAHGGRITAQPREGGGLVVFVTLPTAPR